MKQKTLTGEAHISEKYEGLNPNDVVFTPDEIVRLIVERFPIKGRVLEPCKGEGAFMRRLPKNTLWCEITKDRDFFNFNQNVDWIVTNPPYSCFNEFLDHSFELAQNVVFLVPFSKVFKSWGTIKKIEKYGGIRSIYAIPANRCGFPFGFPCGIFHFSKNYKGPTQIEYAE